MGRRKKLSRTAIFRALSLEALLELADVYWLEVEEESAARTTLAERLTHDPQVRLEDVLLDLLSLEELQAVCARLGLPASGDSKARLTRRILGSVVRWRPFEKAREGARALGLTSRLDWHRYCAGRFPDLGPLPDDVPANPHVIYRYDGWRGYGDWLGIEAEESDLAPPQHGYREFEAARSFVRELNLLDFAEWQAYCRGELEDLKGIRPDDIPALPHRIYRSEGWVGYRDWLGLDDRPEVDSRWKPFKKARRFVWQLGLADKREWQAYCRGELDDDEDRLPLPPDIPRDPSRVYTGAWRGWDDWLGTVAGEPTSAARDWRSFAEAREYAQGLGLKTVREWRAFCRGERPEAGSRPDDIPAYPEQVYRASGWKGYGDWLGTGSITPRERTYRSFDSARDFARELGLANEAQWRAFCRGDLPEKGTLPSDVPARPEKVYRDSGWQGMRDWLADPEEGEDREFRSFEAARSFARSLGLGSVKEWRAFCAGRLPEKGTLPSDVPTNPGQVYRGHGWKGYPDWLSPKNRKGRKKQSS